MVDHDGRISYANPAAHRLLGYADGELVGEPEHAVLHKARANGAPYPIERCPVAATIRDGGIHHSHGESFWRRDGTSFPVEYTSTPLADEEGRRSAMVLFNDHSERSHAAEIERKAQERVARIYESLPDPFVTVDKDWRVTFVSPAGERLPRPADRTPPLGRVLWDAFPELLGTEVETNYRVAMQERRPIRFETRHERSGGWYEISAHPLDDGLGIYIRDVTDRHEAEDVARAASIARPLARKIVQDLVEAGGVAHQILTQVGRNLAAEAQSRTMDAFVEGFADMGLGVVRVSRVDGQRYSFGGSDLLEKRPGSRVSTCSFTLGFLSEAVSRIHGGEPTLGTEIECQSRGAAECKFVVQVKKPEEGLARRVKELV